MKYALLKNNMVTQVQPNPQDGFIKCPDWVCPGAILCDGQFMNYQQVDDSTTNYSGGEDIRIEIKTVSGDEFNADSSTVERLKAAKAHMEANSISQANVRVSRYESVNITLAEIDQKICEYCDKLGREVVSTWVS